MDAPEIGTLGHKTSPILWVRQDRHFYFFFPFLLSRKVRNATIKPPKVQSKVNIPRNIEIISKAVIITHLPSYVFRQSGQLAREATTLSRALFLAVSCVGIIIAPFFSSSIVFYRKNKTLNPVENF